MSTQDFPFSDYKPESAAELQLRLREEAAESDDLSPAAYFDIPNRTWYICPLPCCVIKIYPKVDL